MMALPIRLRLTAWYFAVLAVVLSAFGVTAYVEMRHSIRKTVDEELQTRAEGVHQLIVRAIQRGAEDDLQEGLREHTELRQGGALLQVSDEQGNWLYRSPVMIDYGVPRPATIPKRATEFRGKDIPLRIWTLKVNVAGQSYVIQSAFEMDDFMKPWTISHCCSLFPSPHCCYARPPGAIGSARARWLRWTRSRRRRET